MTFVHCVYAGVVVFARTLGVGESPRGQSLKMVDQCTTSVITNQCANLIHIDTCLAITKTSIAVLTVCLADVR